MKVADELKRLSEEELLSKILSKESAGHLLQEYRSIYQIMLHVPDMEVEADSDLNRAKVKKIAYIREVMNRIQEGRREEMKGIRGPEDVIEYFRFLEDKQQEEFWILLLNAKNKIIKSQRITIGILMTSLVAPRETYYPAIQARAAGIIAIHNHPSGESTASKEDLAVTERLIKAGMLLDIPLLDHVIIGRNGGSSIREKFGYLWGN
jgi:DNA repair protein RadC